MVEALKVYLSPKARLQQIIEDSMDSVDDAVDMVFGGRGNLDKNGVRLLQESPKQLTDVEYPMVFEVAHQDGIYRVETGVQQNKHHIAVVCGTEGETVQLTTPNSRFFKVEKGKNTCTMRDSEGNTLTSGNLKTARLLSRYRSIFAQMGSVVICKPAPNTGPN